MSNTLIELDGVGCKVGSSYILKGVDWKIDKGDKWLLFGRNGSGKTTALSVLSGLLQPSKGNVEWRVPADVDASIGQFGEVCLSRSSEERRSENCRKQIALCSMSIQEKLFHNETALEIVLSGLWGTLGINDDFDSADIRKIKEWFRYFNMLDKLNMPFDLLSKGERQIVLLVRVFISPASLWLLDEPSEGLDIVLRHKLERVLIHRVENPETTIVLVTHLLGSILKYFSKGMILKKGKIVAAGALKEVATSEVFAKVFDEPINVSWANGFPEVILDD